MPLKDLLKKREKIQPAGNNPQLSLQTQDPNAPPLLSPSIPEFTFYRTTSTTQSIIEPPSFPGDPQRAPRPPPSPTLLSPDAAATEKRGFSLLRRHSHASHSGDEGQRGSGLGERLRLGRSRSSTSVNVPDDLPDVGTGVVARNEEEEARWERRATMLARGNSVVRRDPSERREAEKVPPVPPVPVIKQEVDNDIQEAIRLHEAGNLEDSTRLFEKLADPNGDNHPLSQVLFGLALRHGWGCEPDPARAITYLSYAASNSAEIESMALSAGMKKGGAAKGELVLAMYELANCFRNGWGIKKDPVAAKQYYETAANLGDTDAMNEVAWCYLEGFGCKKDKFKAAQFLRLAEQKGSKTLGNTWIWKDKYNSK